MCTLDSLMEFISWTKEGPVITLSLKIHVHTVALDLHKYVCTKVVTRLLLQICSVYLYSLDWFVVKPSEIGMKDGISHLSAGVLVFSFQLAITPPPETVIG